MPPECRSLTRSRIGCRTARTSMSLPRLQDGRDNGSDRTLVSQQSKKRRPDSPRQFDILIPGQGNGSGRIASSVRSAVGSLAIGVAHRLFAVAAGILQRVHLYRTRDKGLHRIPALLTPLNDLGGVCGIVRRRMDVKIVMVIAVGKLRVVEGRLLFCPDT